MKPMTNYYPHPRRIQVHNNTIIMGFDPDIETGDLAKALFEIVTEICEYFGDGVVPMSQMLFGQPKMKS